MILTLRTDKANVEIGLYHPDASRLGYLNWEANRTLATQLLAKIHGLLQEHQAEFSDLSGIVVFQGPGSFTGLRIGVAVANALAEGLTIPIVGAVGEDWIRSGMGKLKEARGPSIILPEYGGEVHITAPRQPD